MISLTTMPQAGSPAPAGKSIDLAPLHRLTQCASGGCPTVYRTGTGTLVVQGYAVSAGQAGVDLPQGESLVEIPVEVLTEAFRNLS